jgi:hypothetical protein
MGWDWSLQYMVIKQEEEILASQTLECPYGPHSPAQRSSITLLGDVTSLGWGYGALDVRSRSVRAKYKQRHVTSNVTHWLK